MKSLTNRIFITLKNWFTPPVFYGDEDKTRIASHVYFLYELWLIASLIFGVILPIVTWDFNERSAAMLSAAALSFFQMALIKKGFVRPAAILLVSTTWLFVNYTVLGTGGVRAVGFGGNVIIVLIAGMLISLNAALIFGFMSILLGLGMAIAQSQGLLPPIATSVNAYTAWLTQGVFLMLGTGVLYLTLNDLQQALQRIRLAEARLRGVFENSPDIILEVDRAGQIIFINRHVEIYLGKNVRSVLPANQHEYALEMIETAFHTGEHQAIEIQTIAPDGHTSWDSIRIGTVKHGGQITSLTVIMTDITAQKDAEAALHAREELYRLISTITADYIFSTQLGPDGQLRLTWVGGGFEAITGYTFEEYVARGGWLTTLHPDDRDVDARDMATLRANQDVISELRTFHKSGAVRWVRVYAHPLWDSEHNRLSGIYGAVQDITERKQAEAERETFIQELEAKNAELERFNYTVSHELKSPIVTIKGFLGSVANDLHNGKYERAQQDLLRVSTATDKMQDTLSDLLELSRIGRIVNPSEEIDLVQLVQEALETVHGRVQARNITVQIAPNLPAVCGDRVRLREVYENLIDNAAKYLGDQSAPLIEIGSRKTGNEIICFVKDNGMGVDVKYHKRIFGLFDKLDATSEGTGIGLALVKRIIETHGGRIWIESEGVGKGSTFCFTIPDGRK